MKTETRKQKAMNRIDALLQNIDKEFFKDNHIGFSLTAKTYCILKKTFKGNDVKLSESADFQKNFSLFYGIQRFVSDSFKVNFYSKMEELRHESKHDIKKLTECLKDKEKGKYQFSFTTKLLNMMNDAEYPIYDSYVATAFNVSPYMDDCEDAVDGYAKCYEIIIDTYKELIPKYKNLIKDFRDVINLPEEDAADMRVLDIIVWKLGDEIQKGNISKEELRNV